MITNTLNLDFSGTHSTTETEVRTLNEKIHALTAQAEQARVLAKSVAAANAHAAEIYVALEEKSDELKSLKEKMEWELKAARIVQDAILKPRNESFEAIDFTTRSESASIINGDICIIEPIDEHKVAFFIADGVGHGVPAALMSIMARTFFMSICRQQKTAAGILTELNRHLGEFSFDGAYLPAFLVIYDSEKNKLLLSGAGHPDMLFYSAKYGTITNFEATEPVIGVIPDYSYAEKIINVAAGDRFFICSDGVTEARGPSNEFFLPENLRRLLEQSCPQKNIKEIESELFDTLNDFMAGYPPKDDMSFIAAEIKAASDQYAGATYGELFSKGIREYSNGRIANSIRCFEDAISLNPENFRAYHNLGLIHYKIKDLFNARRYLHRAFETLSLSGLQSLQMQPIINKMETVMKKISKDISLTTPVKATLTEMTIAVNSDKLMDFCRQAVLLKTFEGLKMETSDSEIVLSMDGSEKVLRFPIENANLHIDVSYFREDFPVVLYLVFEGLAAVFNGTYVVHYYEADLSECKISIIDGVYTHCGERCFVRDIAFPSVTA
jgi:serine phosphatase RsbU (regulator of sigma subunit)